MSTSLLYHGFRLRGIVYQRTSYRDGAITFHCRLKDDQFRCPTCHSANVIRKGTVQRRFRCLPIGTKPTFLVLPVARVFCRKCLAVRQVKLPVAAPKRRYTRAFERYALELCRHMTIQDVARHLGVSWDVIKDLQKANLQRRFAKPQLRRLKQIAIDEIAVGRGHRYLTIVLDLVSGAVVFVGEGKGVAALDPFWRRLKRSGATIEAVAIDMSPAYLWAVADNLPNARIVIDRFHVMKLFNDKLSDLRREVHREAVDQLHQNVLKGNRWLLLKNPENLDPDRREPQRLQEMLRLNQPLATAYYLREELRLLWEQPDAKHARLFLESWCERAEASGIRMLQEMAKTLLYHAFGIYNWYVYPISTAPLEGTNNKIKT
ncbi:MAG TPA: ISL3 family transposase, partial [Planctomycetaceae bacterium]|nr:ISL3 family transposase [Planctomycetaceae bacterium]